MSNAKFLHSTNSTASLMRRAGLKQGSHQKYLMLMALAGVLEHAHSAVTEHQSSQVAELFPSPTKPVEIALENEGDLTSLQAALTELTQVDPELQALIDSQFALLLAKPLTGQPHGDASDVQTYVIGADGAFKHQDKTATLDGSGVVADTTPLLYAQAQTGVTTDAGSGASAATTSDPLIGSLLALGMVALAAGNGAFSSDSPADTPVAKPVNSAPTAVTLSATTVAENAAGAVIGNLTVTDPDAGNTHTYAVDDARFEVVAGQLKLKAKVSLDHEAAAAVNVTVTATDAGGLSKAQSFAVTVTDVAETTVLVGTAGNDTFSHAGGLDDFIITGLAGADAITTSAGNDIVRPGEGADTVNTGAGNDIIVVVGQTAVGQYAQSDISNPSGTGIDLSGIVTLADLNGRAVSEVVAGESIDGGAGTNRLVIYGNVDLTGVTLTNVTQLQVNSTVTVSAQQLNALDLHVVYGDGESVLNITNDSGSPITVDLSGMTLSEFHTLNVGPGVTLVLDQADVASLHYLTGEGTLKASATAGTLNLAGKYTTLALQDKDGTADATHGGANVVDGKLLVGSEAADTLTGGILADRIEGGAGNDTLVGGDGNDILRGGGGTDSMDGGAGDDSFVVVGDISGGGKVDSVADTAALGFALTTLNGKDLNEDADGAAEVIRGGDGDDTLYVYGTADLSNYDITGIEHIEIRSYVTFNQLQLTGGVVKTLSGDGSSVISIQGGTASNPLVVDLSALTAPTLSKIGQIDLGPHVVLKFASLDALGGAHIITGTGTLESTGFVPVALNASYTITSGLTIKNVSAGSAELLETVVIGKASVVIAGTNGDDYLIGTDYKDTFNGANGNDVFAGKAGNDTFVIDGTGKKTILDTANPGDLDTLDFSKATAAAIINLTDGGTVGTATTVQLGAGSATGAAQLGSQKTNVMLIVDVSGSMGSGTRMPDAKAAAIAVLDAYDKVGDVAVRIVTFGRPGVEAGSDFNGKNGWMNVAEAKAIVNGLSPYGGTPYDAAMDVATLAFDSGKGTAYFGQGTNVSYFLSDGQPNSSVVAKEVAWEDFLITHKITSNAIGFGGLNNTSALEPLAFDGTKVKLPTDDHTPGEIPASLVFDSTKLSTTLVAVAKVDFIENVVGTAFGDTLTGNSLNNRIEGGGGNDIIDGGVGTHDVAVFSGREYQYVVTRDKNGNPINVQDTVTSRDGNDSLTGIEELAFTGKSPDSSAASDLIFGNPNYGYYKFFAMLSSAVYVHVGVGDEPAVTAARAFELNNLEMVKKAPGFHLMTSGELGISSSGTKTGTWFQPDVAAIVIGASPRPVVEYEYQFRDGFYGTDAKLSPASSFAFVGKTSDALFVTFRGTDQNYDWITDGIGMHQQYAMYGALTEAIESYLSGHSEISKVYVSGHSLGGQMATLYMTEHYDDVRFNAVIFEAANKLNVDNGYIAIPENNSHIVGIEMPGDIVPDLGDDAGFVLDININDGRSGLGQHPMSEVWKAINEIEKMPRTPNESVTNVSVNVTAGYDSALVEAQTKMFVPVQEADTIIIEGDDNVTYTVPFGVTQDNPMPKNIVLRGDAYSPSENSNYQVAAGDAYGRVIVGNGGKNTLTGSDGNDFIFGGGDVDTLKGGKGDDFLYGGRYSDISLSAFVANPPLTSTQVDLLKTYTGGWRSDDASYLVGGAGEDTMWGSSGDNDYFYVDVNMNGGNAGNSNNVDVIEHFHVANLVSDPRTEDYLIFSADQLGGNIKTSLASWGWSETDVHGVKAYYLENSDKNFLRVSGMDRYVAKLDATKGYDPLFILDVLTDNLYFDQDGIRTVNDYVRVAHLAHSENSLLDLDADQILIVQSFDLI